MRRRVATILSALTGALAFAGAAAAGYSNGGLTPQASESSNAHRIHTDYLLIGFVTLAILILVETLLVVFVVKFRRKGRSRLDDGAQIHGSTKLELIWTVAPAVILAGIAAFVLATLPKINDVPAANANGGRLDVKVEGHQFYWLFTYPNDAIGFDEMVVPGGKNVYLTVKSPVKDVIHSWWIPKLGGKIDAIPGRTNHTWFTAPPAGNRYIGQCAELCGVQHAMMKQYVRSTTQSDYQAYVDKQKQLLDAKSPELGKQMFDHVCAKCHRLDPTAEKLIGPNLGANPILKDRGALDRLVHNGFLTMPPVGSDWTPEMVDALYAYTKTIVKTSSTTATGGK